MTFEMILSVHVRFKGSLGAEFRILASAESSVFSPGFRVLFIPVRCFMPG